MNYKAILLTVFSSALAVFCPQLLGYQYFSFPWYTCLGMVALSFSRFHGVRHGIPCPELLYLASSYVGWLLLPTILPASQVWSADELLWRFDANFGYVEVPLAQLLLNHQVANVIVHLAYTGLPLVGVIIYLALPNSVALRRKFCIAAGLGTFVLVFYRICPAAGPLYLFGRHFPDAVTQMVQPHLRIMGGVALNCAPSGHVAWALVLWWFTYRYCGWRMRFFAGGFFFLTCLATLGLGEHYVIDLVVAVPFAAALMASADREWRAAGGYCLVLVIWLVSLFHGWALQLSHSSVWILCWITISTPWWGRVKGAVREQRFFRSKPSLPEQAARS
jgi:membrane-associated phospholipid phosphatase